MRGAVGSSPPFPLSSSSSSSPWQVDHVWLGDGDTSAHSHSNKIQKTYDLYAHGVRAVVLAAPPFAHSTSSTAAHTCGHFNMCLHVDNVL
jgi:hypothetical protein